MGAVPTCVSGGPLHRGQFPEAGFVTEAFFLALPQEVFVLFGEGSEMHVFIGSEIGNILRVIFFGLSVSQKPWPHGRPAGVEYFSLRNVGAEFH